MLSNKFFVKENWSFLIGSFNLIRVLQRLLLIDRHCVYNISYLFGNNLNGVTYFMYIRDFISPVNRSSNAS